MSARGRTNTGPQVEGEPSPPERAELVDPEQAEAEHDERERGAVVEHCLARQGEAQAIAVGGVLDSAGWGSKRMAGA